MTAAFSWTEAAAAADVVAEIVEALDGSPQRVVVLTPPPGRDAGEILRLVSTEIGDPRRTTNADADLDALVAEAARDQAARSADLILVADCPPGVAAVLAARTPADGPRFLCEVRRPDAKGVPPAEAAGGVVVVEGDADRYE